MPTSDRVAVIHQVPPLPMTIASAIAGRAAWLRRQLPTLDAELHLQYPPIEILPAAWYARTRDSSGLVPGRITISARTGTDRFTVQLSAPALLEYGEDLVLGVLAHEFLHVVYETLTVWRHVQRFGKGTKLDRTMPGYLDSWVRYRRIDRAVQANPDLWLSDRLRELMRHVEADFNPRIIAAIKAMKASWIDTGLPVAKGPRAYHSQGVEIDDAIVERGIELGVISQGHPSPDEQHGS
jgi:hypothetical protein